MTFRSNVLARTNSSLEKPLFWAILANLTISGRVFLTEMVKSHIYGPRPFILAYNQVSMTSRSKVLVRTRKRWQTDRQTDGQTDGHPNSIGPQLLGWGLKMYIYTPRLFIWTHKQVYDHSFKRTTPCELRFRKTAVSGYLCRIRPTSKRPKGTSSRQDLLFEPITMPLCVSVQRF